MSRLTMRRGLVLVIILLMLAGVMPFWLARTRQPDMEIAFVRYEGDFAVVNITNRSDWKGFLKYPGPDFVNIRPHQSTTVRFPPPVSEIPLRPTFPPAVKFVFEPVIARPEPSSRLVRTVLQFLRKYGAIHDEKETVSVPLPPNDRD